MLYEREEELERLNIDAETNRDRIEQLNSEIGELKEEINQREEKEEVQQ